MTDTPKVKIVSLDADTFFTLKLFDELKASLIETSLVTSYSKSSIQSVSEYVKTLITVLVVDSDKIIKKISQEDEAYRTAIYQSYYLGIIHYYPRFSLERFLEKLNEEVFKKYPHKKPKHSDIFLSDMRNPLDILGEYEESLRRQPSKGMSKKKKSERLVNTKEDLNKLKRYLKGHIIGQDQAIDSLINATKLICTGFSERATFFFLGPTGVGKTQLSKLFAEKYCGRHFKIDCGEYAQGHEFNKLIGSPPGYVGHSDTNILKTKSQESDCWVFIFDEIEKASHKLFDLLLSWIETGIITDNAGNELDFSKSIFIFTSNVGVRDAKTGLGVGFSNEERTYENSREEILKEMEKTFSPEFRNRIDFTVFFNQLSRSDAEKIVINELESNVPIVLKPEIINFIIDNGFSAKYGARQLQRFIKTNISLKVAEAELDMLVPISGTFYEGEIRNNEFVITNTESYDEHSSKTTETKRGGSKSSSRGSSKASTRKAPTSKGGGRRRKPASKEEGPKEQE
jgi:ATP-dependent Clp protease ATP-binding subunit ClpA